MKNKNILIVAVVGVVLVLGIVGYLLTNSGLSKPQPETASETSIEEELVIPTIDPSDLGLTFVLRNDKKAAKFEIVNGKDIENVEYQLSYTKEVNGEEVPEGLIGEAKPKGDTVSIAYREFGTCSSGTCRYDKVVSPVKLTLKITKTDGKVYQSEETIDL